MIIIKNIKHVSKQWNFEVILRSYRSETRTVEQKGKYAYDIYTYNCLKFTYTTNSKAYTKYKLFK